MVHHINPTPESTLPLMDSKSDFFYSYFFARQDQFFIMKASGHRQVSQAVFKVENDIAALISV